MNILPIDISSFPPGPGWPGLHSPVHDTYATVNTPKAIATNAGLGLKPGNRHIIRTNYIPALLSKPTTP